MPQRGGPLSPSLSHTAHTACLTLILVRWTESHYSSLLPLTTSLLIAHHATLG